MRTIFEYRYRDGGNFKASGCLALEGSLTPQQEVAIRIKLQDGEFFIAEQIGIPPLYDRLYQWSGGPIAIDHCWHEFGGVRKAMGADEGIETAMTVAEFAARFMSIANWDERLSPHFDLHKLRNMCT